MISKLSHQIKNGYTEQFKHTLLLSLLIRRINESDVNLTPKEQKQAIIILPGLPAYKMESILPLSDPTLSDTIRKLISKHRAVNRTVKDKKRK